MWSSWPVGLAIVLSKAPGHENLVFVNKFLKSVLEIDSDTVRISPNHLSLLFSPADSWQTVFPTQPMNLLLALQLLPHPPTLPQA